MKTDELIAQLGRENIAGKRRLKRPLINAIFLLLACYVYTLLIQCCVGVRPDWSHLFNEPMIVIELGMLLFLSVSSAYAAVLSIYPDAYQKHRFLSLPYICFAILCFWLLLELIYIRAAHPLIIGAHSWQCTLYISGMAVLPSAVTMLWMREGASVIPSRSGVYAILLSFGLSCFSLKIHESNDSPIHAILWHYIPIMFFSILGAWLGRKILRW